MLLQGVQKARSQIPVSRLQLEMVYSGTTSSQTQQVVVEFDRDKRRYTSKNLGTCNLFDGSKVICFDGNQSVTIRDINKPTAIYLFDPRLLGVTTTYSWRETIANAVPVRDLKQIELIGSEKIAGNLTWHIRLTDSFNQLKDLWIDSENNFKVYRYDFSVIGQTNSTLSYYEDTNYPYLPNRIETHYQTGKEVSALSISILKPEKNVGLEKDIWTIAGVHPAVGAAVSDLRQMKRIGYWNGHGLNEGSTPDNGMNKVRLYGYALTVLAVIGFGLVWLLSKYERKNDDRQ